MSPIRFAPQNGPLKAAVIGAGAFGRHHATKYRGMEGVELVGIADPSFEARKGAAATHGVPAVADWREFLGKVDLVSVASPAVTHAEIVRAFLNAGAHVLVEKPIATTIEEADALITLAERMGLILTVGHQERYVFAHTGLLDYEDAPLEVSCWREGPWSGRGADVSVVLDLMIHDLDLIHQLIPGKVRNVLARGRFEKGVFADEVKATVLFENGAVARLETSRIAETRRRGMRAVYADGVVEIDFLTREIINTTPRGLNALDVGDPLAESVSGFVEAARNGKAPLVRPRQARRALETALLIDEASERAGALRSRQELVAYAAAN
ncbi:MAG: Gfo/Idh/MocA family oxidoreductase [Alphaproteobacteria bacterium]|nr:Gfo/Idh/MocA family oxidoreductase [Alphaproteobacteria bacterium]MDE2500151.1 Gfo/Idh/MocA family oxidoreductase [Alphaproteobacteria bacterium]